MGGIIGGAVKFRLEIRLQLADVVQQPQCIPYVPGPEHGGAALPYVLGRLTKNYQEDDSLLYDPREGIRRMYFDSIVYDPPALEYLIDLAGADRVVLGSDYPFSIGDLTPSRVVYESDLDEAATGAILGGTAARLFGVEAA